MRLLCLALLMIACACCNAQVPGAVQIGQGYTKEEISKAKQIVDASKDVPFNWNRGEFQIFEKGPKANGPLLWQVSDDGIVAVKEIEANTRLIVDGVRAGESEPKEHDFPSQKANYWKFKAIKEGATTIWIFANGDNGGPPVVIAKMKITVGQPKPPPPKPDDPPPVDDPLVKAFKAALAQDVAAGKADRKYLLPLAGIYEAASKNIPATVTTIGQLDDALVNARKAAGIPEPEETLLNLRKAVQLEIYSRLGVNKDSGNVALTADTRRLAMVAFGKIAAALEEVAK